MFVEDGEVVVLKLWKEIGICVFSGVYFSRDVNGENSGKIYIRVVLVVLIKDVEVVFRMLCDCFYKED